MVITDKSREKMKRFNLEEAKAGKPVQTKGGYAVRILCFDRKYTFPLLGLIDDPVVEGLETIICFDETGISNKGDSAYDLVMVPDIKERWINLYWDDAESDYCPGAATYASEEKAKRGIYSHDKYVTTIKVKWED